MHVTFDGNASGGPAGRGGRERGPPPGNRSRPVRPGAVPYGTRVRAPYGPEVRGTLAGPGWGGG
ncbi:hypothetical protein MTP06_08850 [Streptomyces sp. PLM4]|uniref:Uncharacterized protein n=1 Tax=Streptomyces albidoflavus TaxID=1886 RepID=A0AA37C2I6_9ACTN|nr:hypothetical protein MTP02_52040 [Streptomyces albus]BDH67436.1 hypothetical protein MTP06_08850 [Streptomyces sp. PLM4]GHI49256.1 hypothetical protein ScoT_54300 [Streptomyces albidoflavus]